MGETLELFVFYMMITAVAWVPGVFCIIRLLIHGKED